jgi:hypothetical protein
MASRQTAYVEGRKMGEKEFRECKRAFVWIEDRMHSHHLISLPFEMAKKRQMAKEETNSQGGQMAKKEQNG